MLYKRGFPFLPGIYVMDISRTVLDEIVIFTGAFIFPQVILLEVRAGETRCFVARNKVITGFHFRIFNHSIEYLDLLDQCIYLAVSSLRIRNKSIIFPGSEQKTKRNTSVS